MPSEPVPVAAAPANTSDLITTLRDKAPKLALALAAGQAAWPLAVRLRTMARDRTTYTVKVPSSDDMYDDLHEWVLGLLPPKEQRALVAWSSKQGPVMISEGPGRAEPPKVRLRYDGTRMQSVTVRGHRVKVVVTDGAFKDDGEPWKPPEITFTARSLAGRQALMAEINDVVRRSHEAKHQPAFRMMDRWGGWERLDDLPPRPLDSVILPAGQLDRLLADVERFLASEHDCARRGIPWHRGHLYEGPPGTGKTSVARAVAGHFGMDVWYLPLADVKKDGDLLRLVNRVSPRSMLLLEDIDVFHAATQRDDDADVTLSGLLNTLDGIATPHGLLTVLTTNTPEVLDHAVSRAGRVDLVEHFGYAGPDEVSRLVTRYYGCPSPVTADITEAIPADVVEACKRHDTPAAALAALGAGKAQRTAA